MAKDTTRTQDCPPVKINNTLLPQQESAKYLGLHLDRKLNFKKHIINKSKQLRTKYSKMYWLLATHNYQSKINFSFINPS